MPESSSKSTSVSLLILLALVLLISVLFTGVGNWVFSFFKGDAGLLGMFDSPAPVSQDISGLSPFDYSGEIRTLSGRRVLVSAMKGKHIFLHFWATWCSPCKKELPDIQRLFDEMKKTPNLRFVLITNEEQGAVEAFMQEKKYRFPVYLSEYFLFERMQVKGIPATFIIDSNGKVVFKFVGSANWDDNNFREFLTSIGQPG